MINLSHQRKRLYQGEFKFLRLPKKILYLLFSLTPFLVQCQNFQVSDSNADCIDPIFLADTIFGPTNAPSSYGKINEFQSQLGDLYSFEKEHHSVWFRFVSPGTGSLTLDIIPICAKDDYDFLIFKYSGNEDSFCENIKDKKLKPIRSVISRNDRNLNSITGLKEGAFSEFVHSGPGDSYGKPIDVEKNEIYYLVLDNVYEYGCGFTLKLHYKISEPVKSVNITILDSLTGEMINSRFDIFDSLRNDTFTSEVHLENLGSYFMPVDSMHIYRFTASAKGYFTKAIFYNPSPNSLTENIKIRLKKIEVGQKVVLDNIYFYGNMDLFLPKSSQSLASLLSTMNDNPSLNIEVQGHVNWPYNSVAPSDTAWIKKLSVMRAKAVCSFLINNGIEEDRLSYKGFGNTHMLFPYAKSESEMEQNRRVEILVISNEE